MSKIEQKPTLAAALEKIQSLFSELRQAEALEAQLHEMVVMKRHRLDALMTEYLELAIEGAPALPAPAVPATPPPATLPPATPPPAIPPPQSVADLPLTPHGNYGAPKDLLQGRPAPSAQHVLDSLNRLMTGARDHAAKQASAA